MKGEKGCKNKIQKLSTFCSPYKEANMTVVWRWEMKFEHMYRFLSPQMNQFGIYNTQKPNNISVTVKDA